MDFIFEYWFVLFGLIAAVVVLVLIIYDWLKLPTQAQMDSVQEWLVWAVNEAEEALGSGTGQRKLRAVYDLFLQRFPWLAKIIPFEVFSGMVDDALETAEERLRNKDVTEDV